MALNGLSNRAPVASNNGNTSNQQPQADRQTAETWLNVGYPATQTSENGAETQVFVGTPLGMALDTQRPLRTNSPLANASNALLEDLQVFAAQLPPGGEKLFAVVDMETGKPTGMYIQIRRNKSAVQTESNPLVRKLNLGQAA